MRLSIEPIKKAIKKAQKSLRNQSPTFFAVPTNKDEDPRTVALSEDMQSELLGIAMTSLDHADSYDQLEYDPDHRVSRGSKEALLVAVADVNDESTVFDIVERLDTLDDLHAKTLVETPTQMYGIGFGTTAEERILFVRKKRVEGITADGKLFAIAGDTLRPVKQPGMLIDRAFDLIVFPEGIVAFDSFTFEQLVKDPDDVVAEMKKNAKTVAKSVPFMPGLLDKLVARGENKPMIRRKLRAIVERDHLAGVTMPEIKTALKEQGKTPINYISKDPKDKLEKLNFP